MYKNKKREWKRLNKKKVVIFKKEQPTWEYLKKS